MYGVCAVLLGMVVHIPYLNCSAVADLASDVEFGSQVEHDGIAGLACSRLFGTGSPKEKTRAVLWSRMQTMFWADMIRARGIVCSCCEIYRRVWLL